MEDSGKIPKLFLSDIKVKILARTPRNHVNFVSNFDQWRHTRWCIRYTTAFIEVLRNGQNWAKRMIFWLILRGFLFTLSYTQQVKLQDFANLKTLWRYIFVVRVSSVYHMWLRGLKFSKFLNRFSIMKWPLFWIFRPYSPKYCLILQKFRLEALRFCL